ncbi:MAG: hypothetical protein RR482_06555, partial [Clostridia bacterium]
RSRQTPSSASCFIRIPPIYPNFIRFSKASWVLHPWQQTILEHHKDTSQRGRKNRTKAERILGKSIPERNGVSQGRMEIFGNTEHQWI